MEQVSPTTCPHGMSPETCEICRILEPTPVRQGRAPSRRGGGASGFPGGLATVAVVAVIGFVVLGWVAAAFFAVLRILELVAIAAVAGWVGWKLGVRRGRAGG
jgi:hypothetical protein